MNFVKRIPIVPTLLVLLAVGVMVRLGFWQLDRMHEKDAAFASYFAAAADQTLVTKWESVGAAKRLAFRRVKAGCGIVSGVQLVAGRSSKGETGWAHVVVCTYYGFDVAPHHAIVLGWTKDMRKVEWKGGDFTGILVPGQKGGVVMPTEGLSRGDQHYNLDFHIVADPPLAGLQPNARPDPRDIPNNHWSYAIQWFLFAGVALVIYALALRKRLAARGGEG